MKFAVPRAPAPSQLRRKRLYVLSLPSGGRATFLLRIDAHCIAFFFRLGESRTTQRWFSIVQSHPPLALAPSSPRGPELDTPWPNQPTSTELLPAPSPAEAPESLPAPCRTSLRPHFSDGTDGSTSRRYCLLTVVLVDPMSRRGDVATLELRDAPANFILCFPLLQIASKVCSFQLIFTCIHRISHTQISSCQNT